MHTVPIAPAHAHHFYAETSVTENHAHSIFLFTYPVNGNGTDKHFHRYQGTTDKSNEHFHRITGFTGPAIPLASGAHVHAIFAEVNDEPFEFREGYYRTILTIQPHIHSYIGRSDPPIGYEPPDW